MTKVLFVCLGNICRSPMAEAVFAHQVKQHSLSSHFERIDSAGTSSYHIGELPDRRSSDCCHRHGVIVNHRGRQVTQADFLEFDWILCMDDSNLSNLNKMRPKNAKAQVKLFGEFDPQGERIIEDPYYGGLDGFEHNFSQVERASIGFLNSLGHAVQTN